LSAGQVQWAPHNKNLVFTGWNTEPRRLGIIHCYNRPCAIYAIPINMDKLFSSKNGATKTEVDVAATNETTKLTLANVCSRSPRFSADGKILVYLASDNLITHNSASKLLTLNWIGGGQSVSDSNASSSSITDQDRRSLFVKDDEHVVIDIVDKYPEGEDSFPGLFLGNLPPRCFIEDRKIIFSSQWKSLLVPLLVDLSSGSLRKVTVPGCSTSNLNVQDVRKDVCALFDGSELNRVPFNFVGRWDGNKAVFRDWKVTPHPPSFTEHAIDVSELNWECGFAPLVDNDPFNSKHKINSPKHFPGIEYLLTLPSNFGQDENSSKTPIILFPHGGPHAANVPIFLISPVFFATLGYAVINVNYRGSLGFGKSFVDALPGHCGDMDVSDCHLALNHVISKHGDKLDTSRIYVMGGSHGGFLTGHLLATPCPSPSGKWSAGVMINAVTNIAHCVGISDIPDWCYVESGVDDLKTGLSKMFDASPISRIEKVNAPTLIVLGAADKRVPMSQSIEYYHALRKQGTKTRMLKYPGAGHGIVEPEQEADYLINTAIWFEQHQ
jgi:acylaminoacyl-peptidase